MSEFNFLEIKEIYKKAISLKDAISKFGNPELLDKLNSVSEIEQPKSNVNSILGFIHESIQAVQAINTSQNNQNAIWAELKADITIQIQNSELIAIGLELPINAKSQPTQIPSYLFAGDINWENSELVFRNLEFSGIKILKAEARESEAFENSKLNFSDLDPNLYIDENKAAGILGISPRTLQGYRTKGGGPKYEKLGKKLVRYKIAEIALWKQIKSNTIV